MTARLVILVDLATLPYSTVQALDVMNRDATVGRLDEVVFGCSKADMANWHAITGQYINQEVMTAMFRAMVAQDCQLQIAVTDCLDEPVFGCSKVEIWGVANQYAITGRYINQDMMTAMFRAMVETRAPMIAMARVMECKNCYAEADY